MGGRRDWNRHVCVPRALTVSSRLFQAETPIEEFVPTPAFPALQYLESVDQGGVAWRAGLRTGDFLIEVTGHQLISEQPAGRPHPRVRRTGERQRRGEGGSPAGGLPDPPGRKPSPHEGRVRVPKIRDQPDPEERCLAGRSHRSEDEPETSMILCVCVCVWFVFCSSAPSETCSQHLADASIQVHDRRPGRDR